MRFNKEKTVFKYMEGSRFPLADRGSSYLPLFLSLTVAKGVLLLLAFTILFQLAVWSVLMVVPNTMFNNTAVITVLNLFITLGPIIGFLLLGKFVEKRNVESFGFIKKGWILKYAQGSLVALVMIGSYVVITLVIGWGIFTTVPINVSYSLGMDALPYVLLLLGGFIIQGMSEEVLLRGWMLPILAKYFNVWVAVFVSSSIFALLHLGNDHVSILPIINLVLFGVFAALYFINDGGIIGIAAVHTVWNWLVGNVFGMAVSGTVAGGASISEFLLTGPEIFTGGAFGPEGGLIVSIILLVGIATVFRSLVNKEIIEL